MITFRIPFSSVWDTPITECSAMDSEKAPAISRLSSEMIEEGGKSVNPYKGQLNIRFTVAVNWLRFGIGIFIIIIESASKCRQFNGGRGIAVLATNLHFSSV